MVSKLASKSIDEVDTGDIVLFDISTDDEGISKCNVGVIYKVNKFDMESYKCIILGNDKKACLRDMTFDFDNNRMIVPTTNTIEMII